MNVNVQPNKANKALKAKKKGKKIQQNDQDYWPDHLQKWTKLWERLL